MACSSTFFTIYADEDYSLFNLVEVVVNLILDEGPTHYTDET